jgi:hypothetical protein
MKNILFLTVTLLFLSGGVVRAQFSGKKFISGSAGITFGSSNPKEASSSNNYGYQFGIALGKFKTDTRASGWNVSSSLGGEKRDYPTYPNGTMTSNERSGINNLQFGLGRFWQFYKHFNDKIGVFAGPDVNLGFAHGTVYSTSSDGRDLTRNKTDKISLGAGLHAGMYYHLSERWWLTGSLAFSNPVSVDYTFINSKRMASNQEYKDKQLAYRFSPSFSFPSVGLGLRYFL